MLRKESIDLIIKSFYEKAKKDFLIGYHFRVISDFDSHIPRICEFWNLQLNGQVDRTHLPFKLLEVHTPLQIKLGELNRWIVLFKTTLDECIKAKTITSTESDFFLEKVNHFRNIIETKLILP